jgi:hypothetical protein
MVGLDMQATERTNPMSTPRLSAPKLALALLATALLVAFSAVSAQAALKHYDGTVLGTNENAGTFRIKTQSGNVKFKVDGRTEFERIAGGLSGLAKGDAIEVGAKEKPNGLVARKVEPQGGGGGAEDNGGGHGGNDDPQPHG